MIDAFQSLQTILNGEAAPDAVEASDAIYRRLLSAIGSGAPYGSARDLACLVRQVLRQEDERQGGTRNTLSIPRRAPWPEKALWEVCGIKVLRETSDAFVVSAEAWRPDWLTGAQTGKAIEADAYAGTPRRNYQAEEADPFLKHVGVAQYRSNGQREAIRAILSSPANGTLVINLPTGAGKSLCAHLHALVGEGQAGLTVVIVPTTALAIDQERALASKMPHETAYFSDLSSQGEKRRRGIRERIARNVQQILFTSPEALVESLAGSLFDAAAKGYIRAFVVDEAHLIDQWGDQFRPHFQAIAGLRRALLRETSFQTLLLTATLGESCLDMLEVLFSEPGPFSVVSACQLRPEPAYWLANCRDEETRQARLLEALDHLPRPLIVYVTRVADVERWLGLLRTQGFKRVAGMSGETSSSDRLRLLTQWREGALDLVVSTSAFGLGVDNADVRSVVHACVPETLDRFYQEVGRGGRDGRASLSLLLYTSHDLHMAKDLNETVLISVKRGLERWQRMRESRETFPDGRFRVSLTTAPSSREGDIDMRGKRNLAWNANTLTLMARAGLIAADFQPPPQTSAFLDAQGAVDEVALAKARQVHHEGRVLQELDSDTLSQSNWESRVEPWRKRRADQDRKSFKLMNEALDAGRCMAEILEEAYSIPPRIEPGLRAPVLVARACGGCPWCRSQSTPEFADDMPTPAPTWPTLDAPVHSNLAAALAGASVAYIFYDTSETKDWGRRRTSFVRWVIDQGIRMVVGDPAIARALETLAPGRPKAPVFYYAAHAAFEMPPLPTLVVLHDADGLEPDLLAGDVAAPTIILLPAHTKDPDRPDRPVREILRQGRCFGFEEFCMEQAI